jgi:hypothetical protein
MVSCILLFCVLYSIRYIFYERSYKKAGKFSKNVHDTAFFIQPQSHRGHRGHREINHKSKIVNLLGFPPKPRIVLPFENPPDILGSVDCFVHKIPAGVKERTGRLHLGRGLALTSCTY